MLAITLFLLFLSFFFNYCFAMSFCFDHQFQLMLRYFVCVRASTSRLRRSFRGSGEYVQPTASAANAAPTQPLRTTTQPLRLSPDAIPAALPGYKYCDRFYCVILCVCVCVCVCVCHRYGCCAVSFTARGLAFRCSCPQSVSTTWCSTATVRGHRCSLVCLFALIIVFRGIRWKDYFLQRMCIRIGHTRDTISSSSSVIFQFLVDVFVVSYI